MSSIFRYLPSSNRRVDVDTWCPLTTTGAPGSPWEAPLVHSSSDPSSRTLTGLDCFLRDMRTTVMELFGGYENDRRDDGLAFIVCIAILTVIDDYADYCVLSFGEVDACGLEQNRKRWRKTEKLLLLTLQCEIGGIIGLITAAETHLVRIGWHLHRWAPVDSSFINCSRYSFYAVNT